jgi:hypothetical protein
MTATTTAAAIAPAAANVHDPRQAAGAGSFAIRVLTRARNSGDASTFSASLI